MADNEHDHQSVEAGIPISDVVRLNGELSPGRIAHEVMERLKASNRASDHERTKVWPENVLMVYGDQWIKWNTYGKQWTRRPPSTRERRFTVNLLIGRTAQLAAKLTQSRPTFTCIPLTTDLEDRRVAKAGERILVNDWREHHLGLTKYLATLDSIIFGTGIIKAAWDPRGGPVKVDYKVERDMAGNPVLNEMGSPNYATKNGKPVKVITPTGALKFRTVSPMNFYVPPGVPDPSLRECQWVIEVSWRSEAEIRGKFPDLAEDFDFGSPDPDFQHIETITSYLSQGGVGTSGQDLEDLGKHQVVEYYEPATDVDGYESGCVTTVVNSRFVDHSPSQFEDDGRYPFAILPWFPKRGQFLSHAWITDQVQPQRMINGQVSDVVTHQAMMTRPNVLAPKGSGIPPELAFNFKVVYYNASAGAPTFWTPPPPSNASFAMLEQWKKLLDGVGASYAFSRGEPVAGVPSALYVQYMQDADAQEIGPVVRAHAEAMEQVGELALELHYRYDKSERMITVIGESNRIDLHSFSGSKLKPKARVMVAEASMLAYQPTARQNEIKEMLAGGLLGPVPMDPRTRKAVLAYMRKPDLVDIETGESLLERFVEETISRVVERDEPLDAANFGHWKQPIVQVLNEALNERLLMEDVWDWDPPTVERTTSFLVSLEKRLEEFQQQAKQQAQAEQMEAAQQELEIENERAKIEQRTNAHKAVAQAGAKSIAKQFEVPEQESGEGAEKSDKSGKGDVPPEKGPQ